MTRAFILASALLIGTFGLSGRLAIAADAKSADAAQADAAKKAQCERDATLQLYVGKEKSRFIAQCLASKAQPPRKGVAGRPRVHPSASTGIPRPAPLGGANPPATSTGSTAPSNAPAAPSTPVTGSSGTSTTGSSATSISGSSGSSLGSGQ